MELLQTPCFKECKFSYLGTGKLIQMMTDCFEVGKRSHPA